MKKEIIDVQNYFKFKVLNGEFEVSKIEKYAILLLVDEDYVFCFWTGNRDIPESRRQYHNYGYLDNFMDLGLTTEEIIKMHHILDPILEEHYKKVTLSEKMKQFEELKKELNIS